MDPLAPASPASSDSDSNSYNTESARLYFGPLKTPERKFVAFSKHLFPPVQTPPLRRSPRLSSPRPRSVAPADAEDTAEESEELVAQLIDVEDEEDEDMLGSRSGTPQRGDVPPDEPSSALAEKISHAPDNPSPPPSPPVALVFFDPLHTTSPELSGDYQADLMSLRISDGIEREDENSHLVTFIGTDPSSLLLSAPVPTPSSEEPIVQQDLISFDSFSDIPAPVFLDNNATLDFPNPMPPQTLSVDDMFSQSPNRNSPDPQEATGIPVLTVEPPHEDLHPDDGRMAVDASTSSNQLVVEMEHDPIPPTNEPIQPHSQQDEQVEVEQHATPQASLGDELMASPLRRSTRPRRSVTPNPSPLAPHPVFAAPPSPARTQVKKKVSTVPVEDEIVSDSQDETEVLRASPSRTALTPNRIRQRSPGKAPLSFHRELGSLSPTSANVLSTLAFTADNPSMKSIASQSSSNPPSMFSFSVFSAEASATPNTPIRSDGPIRLSSPSKSSPSKVRLQTLAPNDPTNTPARRIPMEQAIAQGHVSPEKASRLGFKASINGTTQPSVSTPARRVLISERTLVPLSKSSTAWPVSPVKGLPAQRGRSAEPIPRVALSLKGKEKASSITQDSSSSVIKPGQLPFPIAPSAPSTSVTLSSAAAATAMSAGQPVSSPAKSSLKQVTSRIPRIGAKPYARTVDQRAAENARSAAIPTVIDLSKPPQKLKVMESTTVVGRGTRAPEPAAPSTSTSRVKPTVNTSTALLKRKREAEKHSPVKPRVIKLRQVPPVPPASEPSASHVASAPSTSSALSKTKKSAQGTIKIRRVPDPPSKPPVASEPSPPEIHTPCEREGTTIVSERQSPPQEPPNEALRPITPESVVEGDHLPPGSPMKQDLLHNEPKNPSITEPAVPPPAPTITITDTTSTADSNVISGLRRTTRSRRTVTQDVFTEGSSRPSTSRRKAAVSFHSDDVFSSMSMTALKDLTTSNTVKNQQYLSAKLETEVVRKEGLRPESPAVKIRTISQRQQEEKERQRVERAQRHARRSDEMTSSDIEPLSDLGYSSPCEGEDVNSDERAEALTKHQRGAGDDDDYETPEKPDCRRRLFDEVSTPVPEQRVRRVKWDRGLFTTVYLDEVKLGSRQTLKENRDLKGILASTAKALRLDMLGNLLQAEPPLADLVQENVTVKKFVYDNDIPVPAPEPPVVKSTRSKAKKK